jgi:ATP-dependent DNA ligase
MKKNGARCSYYKNIPLTRSGLEIFGFLNITKEVNLLTEDLPDSLVDGELMKHSLKAIMNILRKKEDDKNKYDAKYAIFDLLICYGDKTLYFDRRKRLEDIFNEKNKKYNFQHIELTKTKIINNKKELFKYFNEVKIEEEGLVLKNNSIYEYKRSKNWLKLKEFDTISLPIIRLEEGHGKNENKLGAFVVQYFNKEVNVGSKLQDSEREYYWKNKDSFIGKYIDIAYKEITEDGSLQFPTFVCLREDL